MSKKKNKRPAVQAGQQKSVSFEVPRWWYAFLFGFACVLYLNTLGHDYAFDDSVVITGNEFTKKGLEGIPDLVKKDLFAGIYGQSLELTGGRYRPFSLVTHAVEYELFGESPGVSHLINVLLYGTAVLLMFITLRRIFPAHTLTCFLACLLFAAHPLHSEAVANIKSRDEILCFIFLMLTLRFLWDHIREKKMRPLVLSGLFYLLSLFSKENGITFLAVIPLTLFVFGKLDLRQSLVRTTPYAVLAVFYLVLRAQLLQTSQIQETTDIMDNPFAGASFMDKLATVSNIMGRYLLLLFIPHPLSSDYSFNEVPVIGWGSWEAILPLVVYMAMIVFAVKKIRSGSLVAYGILFYVITVSIVSNVFVSIGTTMGERFLFLPSLGFCLAFAALAMKLLKLEDWKTMEIPSKLYLPAGAMLLLFSFKTVDRNADWKDNVTLFSTDVKTVPNSAKAHYYYGNVLLNNYYENTSDPAAKQQLPVSKSHTLTALRINPAFHHALLNIGQIYLDEGKADSAILPLKKVLELQPVKKVKKEGKTELQIPKNHQKALPLLGKAYGMLKRDFASAIPYLQKAVEYNPNDISSIQFLGNCYGETKNFKEAIRMFQKVVEANPKDALTYRNIGVTYYSMGDTVNANKYFNIARGIDPNVMKQQ